MTSSPEHCGLWISAGMSLLIKSLCLTIFTTAALSCNPGEYKVNDVCCPMCPAGNVVRSHCTVLLSGTTCLPCIKGTYMDHPNGLSKCFRCKECDDGAGLMEKTECTYTSDTVCACKPGHFCPANEDCDMCQQHRVCKPGEYVKLAGTAKSDTECEVCPPEHFSSEDMAANCTPWEKCFYAYNKEGTLTSNAECRRRYDGVFISFASILLTLGILLWITYISKRKLGKHEENKDKKEIYSCDKRPVQEEDNRHSSASCVGVPISPDEQPYNGRTS